MHPIAHNQSLMNDFQSQSSVNSDSDENSENNGSQSNSWYGTYGSGDMHSERAHSGSIDVANNAGGMLEIAPRKVTLCNANDRCFTNAFQSGGAKFTPFNGQTSSGWAQSDSNSEELQEENYAQNGYGKEHLQDGEPLFPLFVSALNRDMSYI